jgi:hypothetical protein
MTSVRDGIGGLILAFLTLYSFPYLSTAPPKNTLERELTKALTRFRWATTFTHC